MYALTISTFETSLARKLVRHILEILTRPDVYMHINTRQGVDGTHDKPVLPTSD